MIDDENVESIKFSIYAANSNAYKILYFINYLQTIREFMHMLKESDWEEIEIMDLRTGIMRQSYKRNVTTV